MLPNYDKRMKSNKEIQAADLLSFLPASVNVIAGMLDMKPKDVESKLHQLKRQGLASLEKEGLIWYPTRVEKSMTK
ncbi:MAG: hypothetical protein ACXABY_02670 [Candidatus Thorarchaeota archaeon]|jgi:Mn-dependent DtxR family transcriptional regulator